MILDERSAAAPALAANGSQAYLAWTGRDLRLNLASSPDGRAFGDKRTFDERSYRTESGSGSGPSGGSRETVPLAPALAVTAAGLHLAWTGANGRLHLLGPTDRATLDQTSHVGPGLCALGHDLVVAWVGTDRRLNVSVGGAAALTLDQTSGAAPALCAMAPGTVTLAWTGTDRHLNLLTGDGRSFGAHQRLEERSGAGPSVAWAAPGLAVAWTGGDRRVNVLVGGSHRVLDAKSSAAPALATVGGQVTVAWTGTDGRLNIEPVPA